MSSFGAFPNDHVFINVVSANRFLTIQKWKVETGRNCRRQQVASAHEEAVHLVQLLLRQDQTVDLLLSTSARNGDAAHKHRPALLCLRLEKMRI